MGELNTGKKGLQTFLIPPERYISTSTEILFKDLLDGIRRSNVSGHEDSGTTFVKVARLIENISQLEFLDMRRRITRRFLMFAMAAKGKEVSRTDSAGPSEEQLDRLEMGFLEDMYQLMQAAHFRLLSKEDWATAQDEEFTFNSPVEVNWNYMDSSLLHKFWAQHKEDQVGMAPISDHILFFHRGITTVKAQGTYINDKIDLLVQYLLVDPFQALYKKVFKREAKLHIALDLGEATGDGGYTLGQGPPATGEKPSHGIELSSAASHKSASDVGRVTSQSQGDPLQHAAAQTVQRRSLRMIMPDAAAVFKNFFKVLDIQEPAFKNVVVLYRRKVSDKPERKSEYDAIRPHNPAWERRNINVKRFDEIPMADAEMVFPDKKIFLKPLLLIQLAIAVIGGIVAGIAALLSGKLSMQVLMTTLSVVGGRAMQVYTSAQFARARVVDQVTQQLYEQTMDAQEGVVYFLLEEMAQQRIKEYLLAYSLLLIQGVKLSQEQLDEECEKHLQKRFGEKLDFAIENSLPFLLHDGLVKETPEGRLQAAPLDVAYSRLAEKWEGYVEHPTHDDDDDDAEDEEDTSQKKGFRSSLMKMLRTPKSFKSSKDAQENGTQPAGAAYNQPVSTSVDKRTGIITVETPTPGPAHPLEDNAPAKVDSPEYEPVKSLTEEPDDEPASHSKGKKLKEGISNLFNKALKKEQ